ncbi:MAG: hypothetical protein ACFFDT_05505 [Candidatus Hodarchaeota archaeon]
MTEDILSGVFREVYRLIPENREFWIWDAVIDYKMDPFIIQLRIDIPNSKTITTGYGRRRIERDRYTSDVQQLLIESGFKIEEVKVNQYWHFIKAKK